MNSEFISTIYCKPYVKHYLVRLFGYPCDISKDRELRDFFIHCLKKPEYNRRFREEEKPDSTIYTHAVNITISEDDFYRYGWALSKNDQIRFGRKLEKEIKQIMRLGISTKLAVSGRIKSAILFFQQHFDFPEDVWSYETIKREYYRNGTYPDMQLASIIDKHIYQIVMDNLFEKRTVGSNQKTNHENNK